MEESWMFTHVSDEAFNYFHSIDRELYARLIGALGRDLAESVNVMALWIWLERRVGGINLVAVLLSLHPATLNRLAEETASCIKCLADHEDGIRINEITLLPKLLRNPVLNLRFFRENRATVLRGITDIIDTVCARAFDDILRQALQEKTEPRKEKSENKKGKEVMKEVAADDRTVFLTFSKGYPISGKEIREFFGRRFGDFMEELIMQEVGEEEQVLYARMVARTVEDVERIVKGYRAKYCINGKHVWARKYVKKQQKSASGLSRD